MWWNRFFLINLLFVVRRDVCFLLILNCWWTSLRNDIWFEKLPIITSSFGSAYFSHKSFFHFSNMSWLLIVPGIVTITSHGISRPLELVAIYYSLLIIIVPPLLPLDDWQMHNSLATIIHCLYCKIVEWVVLVMSTFKFLLVPKLFYKSGNHEQQLKIWIFCCNPRWWKWFCFCFFYDVDVIRM